MSEPVDLSKKIKPVDYRPGVNYWESTEPNYGEFDDPKKYPYPLRDYVPNNTYDPPEKEKYNPSTVEKIGNFISDLVGGDPDRDNRLSYELPEDLEDLPNVSDDVKKLARFRENEYLRQVDQYKNMGGEILRTAGLGIRNKLDRAVSADRDGKPIDWVGNIDIWDKSTDDRKNFDKKKDYGFFEIPFHLFDKVRDIRYDQYKPDRYYSPPKRDTYKYVNTGNSAENFDYGDYKSQISYMPTDAIKEEWDASKLPSDITNIIGTAMGSMGGLPGVAASSLAKGYNYLSNKAYQEALEISKRRESEYQNRLRQYKARFPGKSGKIMHDIAKDVKKKLVKINPEFWEKRESITTPISKRYEDQLKKWEDEEKKIEEERFKYHPDQFYSYPVKPERLTKKSLDEITEKLHAIGGMTLPASQYIQSIGYAADYEPLKDVSLASNIVNIGLGAANSVVDYKRYLENKRLRDYNRQKEDFDERFPGRSIDILRKIGSGLNEKVHQKPPVNEEPNELVKKMGSALDKKVHEAMFKNLEFGSEQIKKENHDENNNMNTIDINNFTGKGKPISENISNETNPFSGFDPTFDPNKHDVSVGDDVAMDDYEDVTQKHQNLRDTINMIKVMHSTNELRRGRVHKNVQITEHDFSKFSKFEKETLKNIAVMYGMVNDEDHTPVSYAQFMEIVSNLSRNGKDYEKEYLFGLFFPEKIESRAILYPFPIPTYTFIQKYKIYVKPNSNGNFLVQVVCPSLLTTSPIKADTKKYKSGNLGTNDKDKLAVDALNFITKGTAAASDDLIMTGSLSNVYVFNDSSLDGTTLLDTNYGNPVPVTQSLVFPGVFNAYVLQATKVQAKYIGRVDAPSGYFGASYNISAKQSKVPDTDATVFSNVDRGINAVTADINDGVNVVYYPPDNSYLNFLNVDYDNVQSANMSTSVRLNLYGAALPGAAIQSTPAVELSYTAVYSIIPSKDFADLLPLNVNVDTDAEPVSTARYIPDGGLVATRNSEDDMKHRFLRLPLSTIKESIKDFTRSKLNHNNQRNVLEYMKNILLGGDPAADIVFSKNMFKNLLSQLRKEGISKKMLEGGLASLNRSNIISKN